jgi:hypothetical protein
VEVNDVWLVVRYCFAHERSTIGMIASAEHDTRCKRRFQRACTHARYLKCRDIYASGAQ